MVEQVIAAGIPAQQVAEREAAEGFAREIINGEWAEEVEMAGQLHGLVGKRVLRILDNFVAKNKLGEVYPDGVTYVLEGTPEHIITQRVPDVSFVAEARVDRSNTGSVYVAPDLAVEILSPTERPGTTSGKVTDYLRFGTQQVWVIDPTQKQIAVYLPNGSVNVYKTGEKLPGGDLLTGFELTVSEIFEG